MDHSPTKKLLVKRDYLKIWVVLKSKRKRAYLTPAYLSTLQISKDLLKHKAIKIKAQQPKFIRKELVSFNLKYFHKHFNNRRL